MNYLAHVMLALPDPDLVAGSFLADNLKGDLKHLPASLKQGVMLHRKVDSFVDSHPFVIENKQFINNTYSRYAGILLDIFYDHFLTKNWFQFSNFPINNISLFTYSAVEKYREFVPNSFIGAVDNLSRSRWLEQYGTIDGIRSSLIRVSSRGKRKHSLERADTELIASYDIFENSFLEFMPLICEYVDMLKETTE